MTDGGKYYNKYSPLWSWYWRFPWQNSFKIPTRWECHFWNMGISSGYRPNKWWHFDMKTSLDKLINARQLKYAPTLFFMIVWSCEAGLSAMPSYIASVYTLNIGLHQAVKLENWKRIMRIPRVRLVWPPLCETMCSEGNLQRCMPLNALVTFIRKISKILYCYVSEKA